MLPAEGREGDPPAWPLSGSAAHIPLFLPFDVQAIRDDDERERLIASAESMASAQHARELELWETEWCRPQAVEWERNGQEVEVALYVRALVAAEDPGAKVTLRTLVKQQQEALGISLPGLARNRWMIGTTQPASPQRPAGQQPRSGSARTRFRVVQGGAGAA